MSRNVCFWTHACIYIGSSKLLPFVFVVDLSAFMFTMSQKPGHICS